MKNIYSKVLRPICLFDADCSSVRIALEVVSKRLLATQVLISVFYLCRATSAGLSYTPL